MPRPTDYRPEFDNQAYVACKEGGFTDLKLSRLFGVSKSTINRWKHDHPTFWDSIRKGKDEFNVATAENCLLKRLKGFSYKETTKEVDGVTKELETTKVVTKQVVPDTTALIFFLKNRDPERWRDKQEVQHSGELKIERVYFGDGQNPE